MLLLKSVRQLGQDRFKRLDDDSVDLVNRLGRINLRGGHQQTSGEDDSEKCTLTTFPCAS